MTLDDVTLVNGCLWYIPSSHHQARFDYIGIGQNIGALFEIYLEWRQSLSRACPCPAGSIVWHNGLIADGVGANMTIHSRRAMACAFSPDGCTFKDKRNFLPEDYFNSLEVGDLLDNDQQNTLVWHQSWESSSEN